jgi:hypothetical protein
VRDVSPDQLSKAMGELKELLRSLEGVEIDANPIDGIE